MIYIISDTHFSHNNIIEYCNRPYKNTELMNKDIIERGGGEERQLLCGIRILYKLR